MLARRLLIAGSGGSLELPPTTVFKGLINAADSGSYNYVIGPFSSTDGGSTFTAGAGATINPGSGWESVYVKDPMVVWDGTQYVCYYTGFDGTNFRIGRATASAIDGTWTKYGSNPVIAPMSGMVPDGSVTFPTVIYDAAESPPWKMWLTHDRAASSIEFWDSSDGLSWTNQGIVIDLGTAGQFDDTGLHLGAAFRDIDGTYYVYYGGYTTDGFRHLSFATCTNPANAATYTKLGSPMTGFSGLISAGGWDWRSNMVRCVTRKGSQYLVFVGLWNPGAATGPPTDTEEACAAVLSSSLTSFPVPSSLMLSLGSGWTANSAENPTGLFVA